MTKELLDELIAAWGKRTHEETVAMQKVKEMKAELLAAQIAADKCMDETHHAYTDMINAIREFNALKFENIVKNDLPTINIEE